MLLLTARDRWSDKVQGIDAGADDYVAKPFHIEEVLARVRALVRRAAGHASNTLACGPVRLDLKASRVTVDGAPVKLTSHEYKVLEYLMHHPGKVVSRTELTEHLYDQDFDRDFEHDRGVRRPAAEEARRRPDRDGARHGLPDRPPEPSRRSMWTRSLSLRVALIAAGGSALALRRRRRGLHPAVHRTRSSAISTRASRRCS